MIPGLTTRNETRLLGALDSGVTDLTQADFATRDFTILGGFSDEARRLGFVATGPIEPTIVVTDPDRPVGRVTVQAMARDPLLFLDNGAGVVQADIRLLGNDAVVFFNGVGDGFVGLTTLFLRAHDQFFFWGAMATAVELSVEVEGVGQGVVIGDDALIAGEVWIRNHDMHSMHDLATGRMLTRPPVTTVLERHVWLGQGALLLGCDRVGAGAIVGARSIVKRPLPPCVAAVGSPARIVREQVSWGRSAEGMTGAERLSLGFPEVAGATAAPG